MRPNATLLCDPMRTYVALINNEGPRLDLRSIQWLKRSTNFSTNATVLNLARGEQKKKPPAPPANPPA